MPSDKPIFVHYHGKWRLYRGTRQLLACTSIGDVIPVLTEPQCDEPAERFLQSHSEVDADVLCVEPLADSEWKAAGYLAQHPQDTFDYEPPFF